MAYFPDLGTETQIAMAPFVRAVGWLAATQPYSVGQTSPGFVEKLRQLARHWGASTSALAWPAACGPHTCEFCGKVRASGNFGVPSNAILYVAPEMVAHYVEAHGYRPPDAFIEAVLACPHPDTSEYAQVVRPFIAG
jgi:hypothetical protein